MRPRLGVVHSDQPAQHGYGGVRSVGTFYRIWQSQQKGFVHLKMLKILFASGIQAWKWKCPRLCSCTWPGVLFSVTVQWLLELHALTLAAHSYALLQQGHCLLHVSFPSESLPKMHTGGQPLHYSLTVKNVSFRTHVTMMWHLGQFFSYMYLIICQAVTKLTCISAVFMRKGREGYLLLTWAQKITCRCFGKSWLHPDDDWSTQSKHQEMLQSSSGNFCRNVGKLFSDNLLFLYTEPSWE